VWQEIGDTSQPAMTFVGTRFTWKIPPYRLNLVIDEIVLFIERWRMDTSPNAIETGIRCLSTPF
jgi:hypothetical protein